MSPRRSTYSVAVFPGYVASVYGSRTDLRDLAAKRGVRAILGLAPTVVLGTALGCTLLLNTPPRTFDFVVPFLVLGATTVLAFQERLKELVGRPHESSPRRATLALHAAAGFGAVYGGYFNAALGVMLVAALGLAIDDLLARVSALKNAISAVVGAGAVLAYAIFGPVDWAAAAPSAYMSTMDRPPGSRYRRCSSASLAASASRRISLIGVTWLTSTTPRPGYSDGRRATTPETREATAEKGSPPGGATSAPASHASSSAGHRRRTSAKVSPSQAPKSHSIRSGSTRTGPSTAASSPPPRHPRQAGRCGEPPIAPGPSHARSTARRRAPSSAAARSARSRRAAAGSAGSRSRSAAPTTREPDREPIREPARVSPPPQRTCRPSRRWRARQRAGCAPGGPR